MRTEDAGHYDQNSEQERQVVVNRHAPTASSIPKAINVRVSIGLHS